MPVKTAGYSQYGANETRKRKREEHELRLAAWQSLTPAEQLAHLNKLGASAKKQRERIVNSGK